MYDQVSKCLYVRICHLTLPLHTNQYCSLCAAEDKEEDEEEEEDYHAESFWKLKLWLNDCEFFPLRQRTVETRLNLPHSAGHSDGEFLSAEEREKLFSSSVLDQKLNFVLTRLESVL